MKSKILISESARKQLIYLQEMGRQRIRPNLKELEAYPRKRRTRADMFMRSSVMTSVLPRSCAGAGTATDTDMALQHWFDSPFKDEMVNEGGSYIKKGKNNRWR